MTPPDRSLDALLAQAGWARTLARHLVRDADAADDLVQRAWVAALENPPASAIPPRRWLAAVLRNLAREMRRGESRRAGREANAARPDRVDPESPLEQIELQRRLLAAIESLGEPYRATVWARYYEGLAPREIAARDGVPVKTVATRLSRGLHELRARLDREHGGRRDAWTALLWPWIDPPATPAALMGVLVVNAKLKIACGLALAAALICAGFLLFDGEGIEPRPVREAAPEVAQLEETSEPIAEAPLLADRAPVAGAVEVPSPPSSIPPASTSTAPIAGRVIDLDGRPVAALRIVPTDVMSTRAAKVFGEVESDADGRFELPASVSGVVVKATGDAWVTLYAGYVYGGGIEVLVHVAPRRELAGVVVDPRGTAVPGARVELAPDPALRRAEGRRVDGAYDMPCFATTDAEGRFELRDAPLCAATLVATALGHGQAKVDAPSAQTVDLRLVLPDLDSPHELVRGVVLDAERRPVEGAWVSAAWLTQRTGPDGRFGFDLDGPDDGVLHEKQDAAGNWVPNYSTGVVRAVKPGYLPTELALPPVAERSAGGWRDLELVIAGESLAIEGRVVDADGRPAPGVRVRTLGETPFGQIVDKSGETSIGREPTIEDLLRGSVDPQPATSDGDGRFRIEGLLDREYRLVALDPATLRRATTDAVRGGARDARVVLPADRELLPVAGRIVSRAGEPLAEISVLAGRAWEDGQAAHFERRLKTSTDGRFDLGRVDPAGLTLQINSPRIFLEVAWQPPKDARLDALEIPVSLRCMVQVDLGDRPELADEFSVVDERGEMVLMFHFSGPVMWPTSKEPIQAGRSEAVASEERGRTVVLWKGGQEVARLPVALSGEGVTIARP